MTYPANDVKKILYGEKPTAFLENIENGKWTYIAITKNPNLSITFVVPVKDMGEKVFEDNVPAQLLIRWMKTWVKKEKAS